GSDYVRRAPRIIECRKKRAELHICSTVTFLLHSKNQALHVALCHHKPRIFASVRASDENKPAAERAPALGPILLPSNGLLSSQGVTRIYLDDCATPVEP